MINEYSKSLVGHHDPQLIPELKGKSHEVVMRFNDYMQVKVTNMVVNGVGKLITTHHIEENEDGTWKLGILIKTQIKNEQT